MAEGVFGGSRRFEAGVSGSHRLEGQEHWEVVLELYQAREARISKSTEALDFYQYRHRDSGSCLRDEAAVSEPWRLDIVEYSPAVDVSM